MLFLLLLACTPTFDESRKDLEGFRLVAMAADGPDLRALVWSGNGAFHPTAPTVTWTIDDVVVTEAPVPPFTAHVRVESAAGEAEEGELVVQADAVVPVLAGFTRTFDGATAALAFTVETDAVTRWMGSGGTFTETGPNAADWTIANPAPNDDDELEDTAAEDIGLVAIVGLTLDGRGGNAWRWIDVATDAGPYLAVGGRLLPVDTAPADPTERPYLATLTPADNRAGLVLTDVVPAEDTDPGDIVCGLDPFDADALADGRCGMDDAGGARVLLTGAPWP
ncbi:MAG: hypothetical protein Q8P41_10395 [Pseudomonadota bacterium]|nr:hypothetical protein [Pseudomonadota bacterium]